MNSQIKYFNYEDKVYPLEIKWDLFNYNDLTLNIEQVRKWCSEGCPHYNNNGGCPPYSPTAEDLLKDKEFVLLTCKIETKDVKLDKLDEKSKFIEKLLCDYMDSLGYKIKNSLCIDFLNPGHCRGCKECSIETGCKAPERRVYSITGMGIMLGDAIEKLFNTPLQWFTKDNEPQYVTKIMAFLGDGSLISSLNSEIERS